MLTLHSFSLHKKSLEQLMTENAVSVLIDRPVDDGLKDTRKGGRGARVLDKVNLIHILTSRTPIQP